MDNKKRESRGGRIPRAERQRMVEAFHRSGLTRSAFAQQYGVPLATLGWWLAKEKGKRSAVSEDLFQEIRLPDAIPIMQAEWAVEITRADGSSIRFRQQPDVGVLMGMLGGSRC